MADIRILGVGVGTFLIVAFAILWILLCIAGRVFKRSSLYVIGGVLMLSIVLVLVLSPRAAPGQSGTTIPAGATPLYSTYTIGLIMMSLMMFLGALGALCALGGATLVKVSHARAID